MKLSQQINEDIKAAMRSKDKLALEALRAVKSAFLLATTAEGASGELSDDAAIKIIQKLVKQRNDAATIYKGQGRDDLLKIELDQVKIMEKYLPAKMDMGELKEYLGELIVKLGAEGMKDMGKVMGVASNELTGMADGKEISAIVREFLS